MENKFAGVLKTKVDRHSIDSIIDEVVDIGWNRDNNFRTLLKETAAHEAHYGQMDSKNPMRVDDITYRNFEQEPKILPMMQRLGAKVNNGRLDRNDLKTNVVVAGMKYGWNDKISEGPRDFKASDNQYIRAKQWKEIYNTPSGEGTQEKFLKSQEIFGMRDQDPYFLFDALIPSAEAESSNKFSNIISKGKDSQRQGNNRFSIVKQSMNQQEKSIGRMKKAAQGEITRLEVELKEAGEAKLVGRPSYANIKPLIERQRNLEQAIGVYKRMVEEGDPGFWREFGRGIGDTLKEPEKLVPFAGSIGEVVDMVGVMGIAKKLEAGEKVSPYETSIIEKYRAKGLDKTTMGYNIGSMMAQMPTYIAEFATTMPVKTGVQATVKPLLRNFLGRKSATILAGTVGAVAQGAVNVPMVAENTTRFLLDNYEELDSPIFGETEEKEDMAFGEALARGFGQAAVEYTSEYMGRFVTKPLRFLKKAFFNKWINLKGSGWNKLARKVKFDGIIGEVFEEEVGEPAQALLEGREYKAPLVTPEGTERLLTEVLGIEAFGGLAQGVGMLAQRGEIPPPKVAVKAPVAAELKPDVAPTPKEAVTEPQVAKTPIVEGEEPLIAEAKKYSTPEEFVESQPKSLVVEKSRFDTAQDLLKEVSRPRWGAQGLDINRTEAHQLVKYLTSLEESKAVERGIVYRPYGATGNRVDIILGDTGAEPGSLESGKVVIEALKNKDGTYTLSNRLRTHATPLTKDKIIEKLSTSKMLQLSSPKEVKTKSQLTDIWNKAQEKPSGVEYKFKQLQAIVRKPKEWVKKFEEIKKAEGIEREEWITALERIEEITRPKEKPKVEKPVKKETLISKIKKMGGINVTKAKSAGYSFQSFKEYGLLSILKKDGRGIDDIADELVGIGELTLSEGQTPSDALMEMLQERKIDVTSEDYSPSQVVSAGGAGARKVLGKVGEAKEKRDIGYGTIESSEKAKREKVAKTDYSQVAEAIPGQEFSIVDEVLKMTSPAERKGALVSKKIFRKNIADLARKDVVASETLKKAHKAFRWMNIEDTLDFIDRMETGREQKTGKLQNIAKKLEGFLIGRRTDVQNIGKGHLESFIENYFPHIWEDPKKAKNVIASIMGKKRLEGSKSFLKKRVIVSVKEGIERGLKLVSDNPVDLVLLKLHEMDRYIMAQNIIQELKENNLIKFVYSRNQSPDGYIKVDDSAFTVYMPPEITKKDYYDQIMVNDLMSIAESLGIDTRRFVSIGGKRAGYAQWFPGREGGEKVRTKYASPESVLAHEIGHILGYRYNLYNLLGRRNDGEWKVHKKGKKEGQRYFAPSKEAVQYRQKVDKQWRDLADARFKSMQTTPGFKSYVRNRQEKEAVMLEALIHAPGEFKSIAPDLYKVFTTFLNNNAELRPILDIKPSLVLGANEARIKVPGFTTLGHYYAPEPTGAILNNYLSPGLKNNKNKIIGGTYNMLRGAGNVLNQAQLALSAFHGLNVTTDIIASTFGLGLRRMSTKGQRIRGITDIVTAPLAPAVAIWQGTRIKNAYKQQIESITNPKLREMIEAIVAAGGRERMDVFYYNNQIKSLEKTFSDIVRGDAFTKVKNIFKLPFNIFGSMLEVFAKPLMQWYVPTGKLGLFSKLAQHEMERAEAGQINDEQLWERLTQSWDSVDNRMGQLVYDNLFWEKTIKDTLMLAIRSVGWNLGSWREFAGAAVDVVTVQERIKRGDIWLSHKMAYTIGAVTLYSILGATIQYALTGEGPEEPKDYLFPKTGKKNPDGSSERLSLPTYAKDWYAWSHQPLKTLTHKMHPLWGLLGDLTTNKDFFNVEIRHTDDPLIQQAGQVAKHIGKSFKSISLRNYEKMAKVSSDLWRNFAVSITGITSAPAYLTRSPAQKLMIRYIVERIPPKTKTQEQFERSTYRKTLKDRIRKGERIDQSEARRILGSRSYGTMLKEARKTPFADSFNRLSLVDALNVYAISTYEEKRQVKNILRGKYSRAKSFTKTEEVRGYYHDLID